MFAKAVIRQVPKTRCYSQNFTKSKSAPGVYVCAFLDSLDPRGFPSAPKAPEYTVQEFTQVWEEESKSGFKSVINFITDLTFRGSSASPSHSSFPHLLHPQEGGS